MKRSIRMLALPMGLILIGLVTLPPTGAGAMPWTVSRLGNQRINDVSCPTESFCAAVSQDRVMISTNPAGGASTWKVVKQLSKGAGLMSVSCPSASFCVAVGYNDEEFNGEIVTSTNPTGGSEAWIVTNRPSDYMTFVSCGSKSLCIIGYAPFDLNLEGDEDAILTSTNPASETPGWFQTILHRKNASLNGIDAGSCPSISLCVLGDIEGYLFTSTDPTGEPGTWNSSELPEPSELPIQGMSCPSVTLCVVVGAEGIYAWSNPLSGGTWVKAESAYSLTLGEDSYAEGRSVSCPSITSCVVVEHSTYGNWGAASNIYVSTDPSGGEGAWTETIIDATVDEEISEEYEEIAEEHPGEEYIYPWNFFLEAVSCPSALLCVGVGGRGVIMVGTPDTSPPPPEEKTVPPREKEEFIEQDGPPKPTEPLTQPVSCTVPKLTGKTLARAKRLLAQSHCRLGAVKGRKNVVRTRSSVNRLRRGRNSLPGPRLPSALARGFEHWHLISAE